MGEQITPDDIGTEVGVVADLRRGHPIPREIKSQKAQLTKGHRLGTSNDTKLTMSQKSGGKTKITVSMFLKNY
jgi:hypothetical protein